jgi:competence protein ComEA
MKLTAYCRLPLALLAVLCVGGAAAGPVNINSADAATFARELKGIGAAKAAAIIDYRQKHGAFRSVDELALVKGVGQKLIDRNRADLRLDRSAAKPAGTPATAATARK